MAADPTPTAVPVSTPTAAPASTPTAVPASTGLTGGQVLRRAMRGQLGDLGRASALVCCHQGGEALVPVLIGVIIDRAVSDGGTGVLIAWLALLGAVFLIFANGYRFGARFAERGAERAGHQLRLTLTDRILDARGGAESGRLPGALTNVATGDAARVGAFIGALPFGIAAATGILVSAVALLLTSIPLGLLVLLGTPPMVWLAQLLGRPLQKRSEAEQDKAAHASGVAADLVHGLRVLKGLRAEPAAVQRYRQVSQDSLQATLRAAWAGAGHDGAMLAVTGLFLAAVAYLGGHLAADGQISIGGLIAAVGLAQYLLGPLSTLTWVNSEFAQGRGSAVRIAEILSASPAVHDGETPLPETVPGHLRLHAVSHGPLRELDLEIGAGECLGVVAPDPAAAQALLELLGRSVDPQSGRLELDGLAYPDLDLDALRRAVVVDAHDAVLFEGRLGDAVDDVFGVADSLPAGLDTVLAERGRSLSGGQRQRVALARALGADPAVLVVHDPTTAVDPVTEALVADTLARLRSGRSTVIVTTSPTLLAVADRIVMIEDGRIAAEGNHPDLARTRAQYRAAVLA